MVEIVFTNKDSQDERNLPVAAQDLVFGPYETVAYRAAKAAPVSAYLVIVTVTGIKKDGTKDIFGLDGVAWSVYSMAQGVRVPRAGFFVRSA